MENINQICAFATILLGGAILIIGIIGLTKG